MLIALKVLVSCGLVISMVGDLHYSQNNKLNFVEISLLCLDAAVKIAAIFLIM